MKPKILLIFTLAFGLTLQSCFVTKSYERPKVVDSFDIFRPEYQIIDSANIGLVKWQDFFKDPFLQKYIEIALKENIDFAIAFQNIQNAKAYYLQASQSFFPSFSAAPGVAYSNPSLNGISGQGLTDRKQIFQYDLTGSLSWEADIWGKLNSSKKAAFAAYNKTIAAQQVLQTTMVSNLAALYYQLLVLDEQKKILDATILTRTNSLETTKALKEAGTLTEVAVQQSEALLWNATALKIQVEQQIILTENTFAILLCTSPKSIERRRLDQQDINTQWAYGVPYQLLSNRPDIRAAEYALMEAFELLNVARAGFYPSLKLTASAGLQSIQLDELFSARSLFSNVVGSLTAPIWNKRQIQTQYDIAFSNQQIAYLQYKKAILTAGREVSDALNILSTQETLINIKEKELAAYKNATNYSQELVNYGLANYLEVLRAQENELNTALNLLNAQYQYLNGGVQLYKALGGGWQ